jgi:DNA-3-methyladenine glycosylase I
MLVLGGAQAGLSWRTILMKRDNYRSAFRGFDVKAVAAFSSGDVETLLRNPGIVRNRLKIASAVKNAKGVIELAAEHGSFDKFIWSFVDGVPRQNAWTSMRDLPARTEQSDAMSLALRKRGLSFVGSTICYAFMQAAGMVNDHTVSCFRHDEVRALGRAG